MKGLKLFFFLFLFKIGYSLDFVNIPRAETLKKGEVLLSFRIYDNGGVGINSGFGLLNNVVVGVPLDIENAIGDKGIKTSLPLILFLKVKVVSESYKIPAISFGYSDPYGYKERWKGKRIKGLKGLYIVGEKDVILFSCKSKMGFGCLVDIEDYEKGGFSIFAGSSLKLGPKFTIINEIEGVPIDKGSEYKGASFNLGTTFSLAENLDLSLCFVDLFGGNPSRIVKIAYIFKF